MTALLLLLLAIPLVGAVFVALAGRVSNGAVRATALATLLIDLVLAYTVLVEAKFRPVVTQLPWIPSINATFSLQADWLSAVLVLLTAAMSVVAVIASWREIQERVASFHVWILLLQVGVMLVFLARDLILFYIGWELMLVPVLFLIGSWGTGRKEFAAFKFVLFTFTGSSFMLASFLYIYFRHAAQTGLYTFELSQLLGTPLMAREQWWVFLGLLIGFGVKIPLIPLHTWLIDAYPNAPTAGSLLLSAVLSKTGVYGLLRFTFPFGPDVFPDFKWLLIVLSLIAIFYGAWCAFSQYDVKRLIAYSSLSHLGFITFGLVFENRAGYVGSVLQMVNHGLTTAGLFMLAGMLQERLRTRDFELLGGLWAKAPGMGGFLLFFCLASLGIPGTGNFIGELFIVGGAMEFRWWAGALTAVGVFFGAAYSLRLFTATMHGPTTALAPDVTDSTPRENLVLGILAVALIALGFYPRAISNELYPRYLAETFSQSSSRTRTARIPAADADATSTDNMTTQTSEVPIAAADPGTTAATTIQAQPEAAAPESTTTVTPEPATTTSETLTTATTGGAQ